MGTRNTGVGKPSGFLPLLAAAAVVSVVLAEGSGNAASLKSLDISAFTQQPYALAVSSNGSMAVLDKSAGKIHLLDPEGVRVRTIDLGCCAVNPRDLTAFRERIGVLDLSGIPEPEYANLLLFDFEGSLRETLPAWDDSQWLGAEEVTGLTGGGYLVRGQLYFWARAPDGADLGTAWAYDWNGCYGTAALTNNQWAHLARYAGGWGDYQLRGNWNTGTGFARGLWSSDWGGDALCPRGTAGFSGNQLAILNAAQTSFLLFDIQSGFVARLDGLPFTGRNIRDIAGNYSGLKAYVLTDNSVEIVTLPSTLDSLSRNLDFEQATLIGDPYAGVEFDPALKGWVGYCGTNRQTRANYNNYFLDSAGISILDTNHNVPYAGPLHGLYAVLLQAGNDLVGNPGPLEDTSIAQAVLLPQNVQRLELNAAWDIGGLKVSFNGIPLSLQVLQSYTNYSVLGADLTPFAGTIGELRLTAPIVWSEYGPRRLNILIDYLRFWPAPSFTLTTVTAPPSRTVETGSSVTLQARVDGGPPWSFQWFRDVTNLISGATNLALQIDNVQPPQAGAYTIAVTTPGGAVTSSPAMLSVIPVVSRRMVAAISIQAQEGSSFDLECTAGIGLSPTWATLATVDSASAVHVWFDDTAPAPIQRFYRAAQPVVAQPPPALAIQMVPAITLTGNIGDNVRIEAINSTGPMEAWEPLATVTLTNSPQAYHDTSAPASGQRLYRLTTVP